MTVINKATVQNARVELDKALALVAAKTGIDFKVGRILFSPAGFRCKLEGTPRGAAGLPATTVTSPELVALMLQGKRILGATFSEKNYYNARGIGTMQFVGHKSSAHKYPFIVKTVMGKRYKMSVAQAIDAVRAGAVV